MLSDLPWPFSTPFSIQFGSSSWPNDWALYDDGQLHISGGIIPLALVVLGLWFMLRKAGAPGWGALIPIYNVYLMIKLADLSGWYLLLLLIPIVNIVAAIFVAYHLAGRFGHGGAFSFFLICLVPPIGFLIMAFDRKQYLGTYNTGLVA